MIHRVIRPAFLAAAAGAALSTAAVAQSWNNPAGGNWNNALNWSPATVPDAPAAAALINLAGTYTVSVPFNTGFTVSTLGVNNASATLNIVDAGRLFVGGGITNAGVININNGAGGNGTYLLASSSGVSLSGSGRVVLQANANFNNSAYLTYGVAANSLSQSAGHTIQGTGRVYVNLANAGLVDANVSGRVIEMLDQPKSNSGTMRATGGGILQFTGIATTQGGSGLIQASGAGSLVQLSNCTITGGTVQATGGGLIYNNFNTDATLDGVTLSGPLQVADAGRLHIGPGSLSHDSTIDVNTGAGGNGTFMQAMGNVAFGGTGTVTLRANANFNSTSYLTYAAPADTLTHPAGHTINGTGRVYVRSNNAGLINANLSGRVIEFLDQGSVANTGTLKASGGGVMQLSGVGVTQSGPGQIAADGGEFRLQSASITGGPMSALNGGLIVNTFNQTSTLDGVTLSGPMSVVDASDLRVGAGGITNNGTIDVNNGGGGNSTRLTANQANAPLAGSGVLTLNANGDLNNSAYLSYAAGGSFTHGAQHTIHGRGRILAPVTNNGTILADRFVSPNGQVLELADQNKTNNNLMRATGGGIMQVSGITIGQSPTASLEATGAGSQVRLQSATINGGLLTASGGGLIQNTFNQTSGVSGVTLAGPMQMADASVLNVNGGGLVNNGTISVNDGAGGNPARIVPTVDTSITGTGTITLKANGNFNDSSYLAYALIGSPAVPTVLTLGPAQTVNGSGRIYSKLVNNGVVTANVAGRVIDCLDQPKTNNNVMSAVGGGVLQLTFATVTQAPAASLQATGAGSEFRLHSGTVNGGLMTASGGGQFVSNFNQTNTVDNVTLTGPLQIVDASALNVGTGGLVNNGTITVNNASSGNSTRLVAPAAGTVSGTGSIVLKPNAFNNDSAFLYGPGGAASPLTIGAGQVVSGSGRFYGSIVSRGKITPDQPFGTPNSVGLINQPSGSLTMAATSSFDVQIASIASYDRITGGATIAQAGALSVVTKGAYVPAGPDMFDVVTGASITGTFSPVILPATGSFGPAHVVYLPTVTRVVMCYANCDGSNVAPTLNVSDFACFLNAFAAGDPYANCDASTTPPVLNVQDFACFLNKFAAGCP